MGAAAEEPVPLRLAEAVKMTLAHNPMHKAALADTKATLAVVREAQAPMLPRITFAENFTGGNDPVFVFGTKLRQQEFTARDFALNELNRPTPIGNYASLFLANGPSSTAPRVGRRWTAQSFSIMQPNSS